MEPSSPIVGVRTTHATGRAEREAVEATLGADKAYDAAEHVAQLRAIGVTPHMAQHTKRRRSAIDGRGNGTAPGMHTPHTLAC